MIQEEKEMTENISESFDSVETTYISLIQQYLSLFLVDNATFLAERMVAYRSTLQSVYLLGICYFRGGSPQRARSVLLQKAKDALTITHALLHKNIEDGDDDNYDDDDDDRLENSHQQQVLGNSILYLLATCCYDLQLYPEAEDHLLRACRAKFMSVQQQRPQPNAGTKNRSLDMDDWIVQTNPCPIPNGPAGLHLLGKISMRRDRRKRAERYFRMSLKLDPLLWTSYEALCEMGAAVYDDPVKVFGVVPSSMAPPIEEVDFKTQLESNISTIQEEVPDDEDVNDQTHSTIMTPIDTIGRNRAQQQWQKKGDLGVRTHGHTVIPIESSIKKNAPFATPMTPAAAKFPITDVREDNLVPLSGDVHSTYEISGSRLNLPSTTLFQADTRYSGDMKAARRFSGTGVSHSQTLAPPTSTSVKSSIVFNTPGLTPIPKSTNRMSIDPMGPLDQHTLDSFTMGNTSIALHTDSNVVSRAKTIVDRMYYQPSPEITPPNAVTTAPLTSMKLLRGKRSQSRFLEHSDHCEWMNDAMESRRYVTSNAQEEINRNAEKDNATNKSTVRIAGTGTSKSIPFVNEEFLPVKNDSSDNAGVQQILELLCLLGTAQRYLCQYQCGQALEAFLSLNHSQYETGWVLHQVGRAHFELADYHNAQKTLESMEKVEPHRIKGLDILSTTLWHLKKEVELSNLAQRAIELNRLSPEAWCIVGNCFSLQKEHENALICFRRSLQLDNSFTYSHTLCGHEYASNDDFEKAIACFRNAIRSDERHYNAWYGLGAIYFRQEKYDLAEKHFEKALSINPNSSVLHCNLGMAQFSRGKPLLALDTLANAFRLDPRNPQTRFQRATIFMSMDKPQEALEELEKVKDAAPKEASVYFAMGKVYKRLGRTEKAMRCFLTALDLDPKDNKLICAAMERLNEPDVDEDIAAF